VTLVSGEVEIDCHKWVELCTAVCDDELKPYLTFPTRIKSQIDFRSSDLLVSPRLNEDVEHFAFIIDCTPKIQAMPRANWASH